MGEGGWIASLDIRIAAGYYKVKLRIVEVPLSETERGMGTVESARCKAFVTAAETGSFSKAGEVLGYTPS